MSVRILEGLPDNKQLPEKSLGLIFYNKLQEWDSQRVAIVDTTNKEINYGTFLRMSLKVARKLQYLGVKKGDVITIVSENRSKYLATTVGSFFIGATVNKLNHDYTTGELKHFLAICKPVIIFCSSKTLRNIIPLQNEPFFPNHIVNYENDEALPATFFDDFLAGITDDTTFSPIELDPKESVALILTSSGTTGLPKCVQLTHANVRITMLYIHDPYFIDINETDSIIGFLPFFHIFGCALGMAVLLYGGKFSMLEQFIPERFLQILQDQKVTKLLVVPPVLLFLVKHPLIEKYDLSSISDIVSGAAPASRELEQMVVKKMNVKCVRQLYGMTEVSGAATIIPKNIKKYGSAGKVTTSHLIKVCDPDTGKILPSNEVGELRIKGGGVMKGYLGNEDETLSAFDEDGFLKSGDLGYYDEEGYFYIVGRLKEVIKYKGFQVSASELETLLVKHDAVKDAGVVGKPDERAGEVPVAFIVRQPEKDVTEAELTEYVSKHLSIQKHLYGGVRFVEEIPKNASGKILRRKLKELL